MVYPPRAQRLIYPYFEVDSTESVWYRDALINAVMVGILKLTPQSQYGIHLTLLIHLPLQF